MTSAVYHGRKSNKQTKKSFHGDISLKGADGIAKSDDPDQIVRNQYSRQCYFIGT